MQLLYNAPVPCHSVFRYQTKNTPWKRLIDQILSGGQDNVANSIPVPNSLATNICDPPVTTQSAVSEPAVPPIATKEPQEISS